LELLGDVVQRGWLSGQAAGAAIADLLLGAANPSGRLAEALTLKLQDTPSPGTLNGPGMEAGQRGDLHGEQRRIAVGDGSYTQTDPQPFGGAEGDGGPNYFVPMSAWNGR